MTFGRFFLRRMLMVIPLMLGIVFATFMLVRVGGLDPVGLPERRQEEEDDSGDGTG